MRLDLAVQLWRFITGSSFAFCLLSPTMPLADPCEAPLPRQAGQTFQGGVVRYVVHEAALEVAGVWESERAVPPAVIWRRTLDESRLLTSRALT